MNFFLLSSLLCLLTPSAMAFVPTHTSSFGVHHTKSSSAPSSSSSSLYESKDGGLVLDTNFDGVNLVRLMGLKKVKKIVRKSKRNQNMVLSATTSDDSVAETVDTTASSDSAASSPLKLIIAGAPASGKGTQCEIIKDKYGVVHLSTGDMLRAAVAAGTEVGKSAKEFMDAGKLVPDSVIIGVVKDRLAESDCTDKGWLLDGFPRTPAQAEALAEQGVTADCFLFLNVPDEILVERVVGRRTDPETGKIYHMTFSPPPADDEELLGRLVHRSDDTEEKVKVRLEQFHANVEAVKGSYTDISVDIDGTSKPDVVSKAIDEAIAYKVPSAAA